MERKERTAIFEPLLLILKQRTGVATILGIILAVIMYLMDFPSELTQSVVALVFVYVGGQKWVDAKEASAPILDFTREYEVELKQVKDVVGLEKSE